MSEAVLSGYQALQLFALGPCLFVVFFLCIMARRPGQVAVPVLYFLALAASFMLPLMPFLAASPRWVAAAMLVESTAPALSFLLVVQFIGGRVPPVWYWSILAVPLLGGGSFVYAMLQDGDALCVSGVECLDPPVLKKLYGIFSTSLTFLLTVVVFHRIERASPEAWHRHRVSSALVFALIVLNLMLLGIDLAELASVVGAERAALAATVVRIGFVYLVLTSVFRVFDKTLDLAYERAPTLQAAEPSTRERELAAKVTEAMEGQHAYRAMDMGREKLARQLAVSEQALSRAVNQCLGQSISTLVNRYRVAEAKKRLAGEATAITTIAFEVGFNSIPSFNRVFRQMEGISPTQYRAAQKPATQP